MTINFTPIVRPPWESHSRTREIDETLYANLEQTIDMDWQSYEYERDGVHFTKRSIVTFCHHLCQNLPTNGTILIITDSTLAWHLPTAMRTLRHYLPQGSEVDAVSGSGFVALAKDNAHFRSRLAKRRRRGERYAHILLMGGWNDMYTVCSETRLCNAVVSCVDEARRLIKKA